MKDRSAGDLDPLGVGKAFADLYAAWLRSPEHVMGQNLALMQRSFDVFTQATRRAWGLPVDEPAVQPRPGDKRFAGKEWTENAAFDLLKQSYLLTAEYLQSVVAQTESLDGGTKRKALFWTKHFVDALSPSNFAATNPEVLRATVETKGENLRKGLARFVEDLKAGKLSLTDVSAFEVGRNLATTPGQVVYRNPLVELIQYAPTTALVRQEPVLIVPPWINKYYILDLQPQNSFIAYLRDQGFTVFVISWRNPDEKLAQMSMEDYLFMGPVECARVAREICGAPTLHLVGYCIGGTLSAMALGHWAALGERVAASATFFTSLVDFTDAGDLKVFIDRESLPFYEQTLAQKGYLHADQMAATFSMLRANDLIWNVAVNNYLLGKDPAPFDLLFWNNDSTHLPTAMFLYYLENMYVDNNLAKPNAIEVLGTQLDLSKIEEETFCVATIEDHIAPWRGVYRMTQLFGGPVRFVLSHSGHIAGIINPPRPEKQKGWYRLNAETPADPDAWLAGAEQQRGSWWPHWIAWLRERSTGDVPAREPGTGGYPPLAAAPGTYVRER